MAGGEALGHAPRGGLARDEAAARDALAHANKIGMGSARGGATVEPAQTTLANLKRQGWKLKGVVAALTAAEALAAGFTHEDYAAAHEKHAAAPELDATATQAAESGVTGD